MENCIDLHAPIKKLNRKQIRETSKPWINLYIIKMISYRNKLGKRKILLTIESNSPIIFSVII